MLHREDPEGLIVITQPVHAWVAAQLARRWGSDRFGTFAPWEEVCLGAEQHDLGMAAWEREPTLNPQTGRPYSFMNMPTHAHVRCWATAARQALAQGRYTALLTSLHGTGLYEQFHDYTRDTAEEAQLVRSWLKDEHALQEELLDSLRHDPVYAPHATPAVIARNRQLVATWDRLSLALCHGVRTPQTVVGVPTATEPTPLSLVPIDGDPTRVTVDPWPFRDEMVDLVCEGRRLPQTFTDESAMRAALAAAPWVTIVTHLRKI